MKDIFTNMQNVSEVFARGEIKFHKTMNLKGLISARVVDSFLVTYGSVQKFSAWRSGKNLIYYWNTARL